MKKMLLNSISQFPEDHIFVSFEIGKRKSGEKTDPETDIFQFVLCQLGADPSEVLYLDDIPNYTYQARLSGIYAVDVPEAYQTIIPQIEALLK